MSGQQQVQANAVALLLHHPALMPLDPAPTKRILADITQIDAPFARTGDST